MACQKFFKMFQQQINKFSLSVCNNIIHKATFLCKCKSNNWYRLYLGNDARSYRIYPLVMPVFIVICEHTHSTREARRNQEHRAQAPDCRCRSPTTRTAAAIGHNISNIYDYMLDVLPCQMGLTTRSQKTPEVECWATSLILVKINIKRKKILQWYWCSSEMV